MSWVVSGIVILIVVGLFVIVTDGRYFGKWLVFLVYDRLGPSIFGWQSERERWLELVAGLNLRGDEKVLDVGTAVGDLPLSIASMPNFQGQVVGVDWSARMIAQANASVRQRNLADCAQFQVVDIRQGLPFPDDSFDLVFCLGLIETWPYPEKILAELHRVLTPDGLMVLSLYKGTAAAIAAVDYDWYQKQLTALGCTKLEIRPCRGNQDVVVAFLGQQAV